MTEVPIIYIISMGVIICLILIIIYFKQIKPLKSKYRKHNNTMEEHIILLQQKNISMNERIDQLENELLKLDQKVNELTFKGQPESDKKNSVSFIKSTPETFDKTIHYTQFLQKNHDIVKLLSDGRTTDQVAQMLNKSIREVEMVSRLLKG
ncbi:MAG: hypothetical protein D5S00_09780 [Tindallia sp. MSAO_Bac2]|nr:MAG: hypothetical protein D5S00_09780 [Tindallia sp. MSAO_Bac2]